MKDSKPFRGDGEKITPLGFPPTGFPLNKKNKILWVSPLAVGFPLKKIKKEWVSPVGFPLMTKK